MKKFHKTSLNTEGRTPYVPVVIHSIDSGTLERLMWKYRKRSPEIIREVIAKACKPEMPMKGK